MHNNESTLSDDGRLAERQVTRIGVYGMWIQNGRILLVQKGPNGIYAGRWDLPGGGIEFGESPEEALIREWKEEVGMHVTQYRSAATRSVLLKVPPGVQYPACQQFHHLGLLYHIEHAEPHPTCVGEDPFAWHLLADLTEDRLTPFACEALKYK